jgi:hypothetical protein
VSHLTVADRLAGTASPDLQGRLLVELAAALDGAGALVEGIDAAARAGDVARQLGRVDLLIESAMSLCGSEAMWALNRDRRVRRLVADALHAAPEGTLNHALLTAKLAALTSFSVPVAQRRSMIEPAEAVALASPAGPEVREFLIDAIWASDPLWPDPRVARLADELEARCERPPAAGCGGTSAPLNASSSPSGEISAGPTSARRRRGSTRPAAGKMRHGSTSRR